MSAPCPGVVTAPPCNGSYWRLRLAEGAQPSVTERLEAEAGRSGLRSRSEATGGSGGMRDRSGVRRAAALRSPSY
ncbi:unnamed protein product [Boreogadus saida]